jgi:hypothetical protein
MKTKILFFGNEQLAQGIKAKTPIFDALVNSDQFEIQALLLTNPNPRKPYQIEKAAKAAGIPVHFSKNSAEILEIIASYDAEVAVLASFGKIIPDSVIGAFPCGGDRRGKAGGTGSGYQNVARSYHGNLSGRLFDISVDSYAFGGRFDFLGSFGWHGSSDQHRPGRGRAYLQEISTFHIAIV